MAHARPKSHFWPGYYGPRQADQAYNENCCFSWAWLGWVLLGLALILASPQTAEAQRQFMQPITISPAQLMEAYQRNFYEADAKYTGKLLLVTGRITRIAPPQRPYNFHHDKIYAYITMDTGRNLPLAVFFWNWEAQRIYDIKTGATITVMGFCQGVPPHLSLVDACVYPAGCGGPVPGFKGPYFKLPPSPLGNQRP